jgi:hypothetical protein
MWKQHEMGHVHPVNTDLERWSSYKGKTESETLRSLCSRKQAGVPGLGGGHTLLRPLVKEDSYGELWERTHDCMWLYVIVKLQKVGVLETGLGESSTTAHISASP